MTESASSSKPLAQDGLAFEKRLIELEQKIQELRKLSNNTHLDLAGEITGLEDRLRRETAEVYAQLSPWERVKVARHAEPAADLRLHRADARRLRRAARRPGVRRRPRHRHRAARAGRRARPAHRPPQGQDRQGDGWPATSAARIPRATARRCAMMRLAEKFDAADRDASSTRRAPTPASAPRSAARPRPSPRNLLEMFAAARADRLRRDRRGRLAAARSASASATASLMLENAYYSVISPEGCAAILWKSGEKAPEAAEALKLTGKDLLRARARRRDHPEPLGGAHRDAKATIECVRAQILEWLTELGQLSVEQLLDQRFAKFRRMGVPLQA